MAEDEGVEDDPTKRGEPEPTDESEITLARGDLLGRYLILAPLGAGGMGEVFEAYDPELDRRIAIKILRRAYLDERGRARFQREAQAMAQLAHPNVVRVYEFGTWEGQLFIAMELVDGMTLTAWRARAKRGWREIVEVMVRAGRGIAAAHQAGLIHRDIKPANILVNAQGGVLVMDFGVARPIHGEEPETAPAALGLETAPAALGLETAPAAPETVTAAPELAPATGETVIAALATAHPVTAAGDPSTSRLRTPLTVAGDVVGTPAYMAPEQRRGVTDARTDQYSFCVTLSEALFGRRGRADARAGRADARVPAWIRAAIERGLAEDPARRFPTIDALLEALTRDPWARWRRVAAAAAALALVGAIAGVTVARLGARPQPCPDAGAHLAGAWDDAVRRRTEEAFAATGLESARDTYRRLAAALDRRAADWVAMRGAACEATRVRGEQSEHLLDLRMQCLDRRLDDLRALTELLGQKGDPALVNRAVQAALSLPVLDGCADAQGLLAAYPPPDDPAVRGRVDALRARLAQAAALERTGHYDEGLRMVRPLVDQAGALAWPPVHAEAQVLLGVLEARAGDARSAEGTLQAGAREAARARDDVLVARAATELVYVVGYLQARHAEGIALASFADTATARAGDDPNLRADVLNHLATVLAEAGRFEESRGRYEESLALRERALGPDHPDVGRTLNNLATTLEELGRYPEALAAYERALAVLEHALGPDHPLVAAVLNNVADLERKLGRFEEARAGQERALAIKERMLGPDHIDVAHSLSNLAHLLVRLGRPGEAMPLYRRALAIEERALGPDRPQLAVTLEGMVEAELALGAPAEARAHGMLALAINERALGLEHPHVASALRVLADVDDAEGKLDDMLARCRRALAIDEKARGKDSPRLLTDLACVGRAHLAGKHAVEAAEMFDRALALDDGKGDPDDRAEIQFFLARAVWDAGRDRARAVAIARKARDAYAASGARRQKELAAVDAWLARAAR